MEDESGPHKGLSPLTDGLWFIADAARALSKQEGMSADGRHDLARRMSECAALSSEQPEYLRTRHLESKLPKKPGARIGLLTGVYPADVNSWLEAVGAPYRWRPDDAVRLALQQQRQVAKTARAKKPPPPERLLRYAGVPGAALAALTKQPPGDLKSVVLVAQEAAADHMRREVQDHGEEGSVRQTLVHAWRDAAATDFLQRIGFHLREGQLTATSLISGAPYNPRFGSLAATDPVWMLAESEVDKALRLLGQEPPNTRPTFTTSARPLTVPSILRQLPPDTEILVRTDFGGRGGVGTARAGDYIAELEILMARQAQGWFTLDEAGQQLEEAGRGAASGNAGWIAKLVGAAQRGELPMHEPVSLARIEYGPRIVNGAGQLLPGGVSYVDSRQARSFYEWAHVDDLNHWLNKHEARLPFRFEQKTQSTAAISESLLDEDGVLGVYRPERPKPPAPEEAWPESAAMKIPTRAAWIGHSTARRRLDGDSWNYEDPENQSFAIHLMLHGQSLVLLDAFIERLEGEGVPAAAELRHRRLDAWENRSDREAFERHVEWILNRKREIEAAEKASAEIRRLNAALTGRAEDVPEKLPPASQQPPVDPTVDSGVKTFAVIRHSTVDHREDILTPALKKAWESAGPDASSAQVWAQLQKMARENNAMPPLVDVVAGGVLYEDGMEQIVLTRKNFGDRFRRLLAKAR